MSLVDERTPEQILADVSAALDRAWDMKADGHGRFFCVSRDGLMLIVEALYGPADEDSFEPEEVTQ